MSLAFPSTRNNVPDLISTRISRGGMRADNDETRSASGAWSFCSGQDSELASSPDEGAELLNLREVRIDYGSPAIDTEPDSEGGNGACGMSEIGWEKAGGIAKVGWGLTIIAASVGAAALGCLLLEKTHPESNACAYMPLVLVPSAIGAIALTGVGVQQLVDAYKERNGNQSNFNA